MKVFVTGATGFIGSAVVQELLRSGHQVLGLARSATAAQTLHATGAMVQQGDLEDEASLKRGVAACDGVIHTGFIHDFSRYKAACEIDRRVIATLRAALLGTDKPMLVTSGSFSAPGGRHSTEDDRHGPNASATIPRAASEEAADELVNQGARVGIVRPSPSVHGKGDHGFVPMLLQIAKHKGTSAYIADGTNRWNAIHRMDAARVYVRGLERLKPGTRFHAIAEPDIPFIHIATAIAQQLNIPLQSVSLEAAQEHFGWLAWAVARDCPSSSALTQATLEWTPSEPTLLDDLASGAYA